MKYALRSVKYFIYICCVTTILIAAMVALKFIDGNVENMFRNGYKSIWMILGIFAVFSAIYPLTGFMKNKVAANGSLEEHKAAIRQYIESKGYVFEKEKDGQLCFRKKGAFSRLTRFFEDRVTVFQDELGCITVEGLRKDVVRLGTGLEGALRVS